MFILFGPVKKRVVVSCSLTFMLLANADFFDPFTPITKYKFSVWVQTILGSHLFCPAGFDARWFLPTYVHASV